MTASSNEKPSEKVGLILGCEKRIAKGFNTESMIFILSTSSVVTISFGLAMLVSPPRQKGSAPACKVGLGLCEDFSFACGVLAMQCEANGL